MALDIDLFGVDGVCIKVYDPTTKSVIATYRNYAEASRKLGLTNRAVTHACVSKKRKYSPFLKKEVAIRISRNEKVKS